MKRTLVYVSLALLCVAGLFAWQHVTPAPTPGAKLAGARAAAVTPAAAQVNAVYGSLPLSFEANRGQTDSRVQFLSRGNGYNLFLTPSEAVLSLTPPTAPARAKSAVVRMRDCVRPTCSFCPTAITRTVSSP